MLLFSSDGPSDELQSIQIYASSPSGEHGPSAKCHAQMAFKESAKLLGVDATVDWIDEHAAHNKGKAEADQTPAFLFEYATPPPGLAWAQVNFFLADVLQLTAEERYCETPFPPPASVKVGSSGNCGPITG